MSDIKNILDSVSDGGPEESIGEPCYGTKVLIYEGVDGREAQILHDIVWAKCGVYLLERNGLGHQIGIAKFCEARGFDDKIMRYWQCVPKPKGIKRFSDWPQNWGKIPAGLPCNWTDGYGWYFARLFDGRIVNFKDLGLVPPYNSPSDLDQKFHKMLAFRAKHDDTFPSEYRNDFGEFNPKAANDFRERIAAGASYEPGSDGN